MRIDQVLESHHVPKTYRRHDTSVRSSERRHATYNPWTTPSHCRFDHRKITSLCSNASQVDNRLKNSEVWRS